ncbi:tetratricopeptide repeat protein [Sansalvadorimonas verongulae]|uniref:tetratricopeptide repeat protein n=1 Tax=Sansalvadorimonas verongulae TaxID=2172824 RepID=UPI0018AD247B|nr:hypothetical protein [Sansalvadorimonas verongulae]
MLKKFLALLVLSSALAGCSTSFVKMPLGDEQVVSYEYLEQATSLGRPSATSQLLREGRKAWQAGNTAESLQKLGRALRISPDDGLVYFYLASVRESHGDIELARSLAQRGLFFSSESVLRDELERMIQRLNDEPASE